MLTNSEESLEKGAARFKGSSSRVTSLVVQKSRISTSISFANDSSRYLHLTMQSAVRVGILPKLLCPKTNRCIPTISRGFTSSPRYLKANHQPENQIDNAIGKEKEIAIRTPWHREGADMPPVKRQRQAGAMTKGDTTLPLESIEKLMNFRKTTYHSLTFT